MQSVLTLKGVTWNVFNENKQIQAAFTAAVSDMLPSIEANDVFGVRAIQNKNRRRLSSSNPRRLEESFIVRYNVKTKSREIVDQVQAKMDESTFNDEFVQMLKKEINEESLPAPFDVVSASSTVVNQETNTKTAVDTTIKQENDSSDNNDASVAAAGNNNNDDGEKSQKSRGFDFKAAAGAAGVILVFCAAVWFMVVRPKQQKVREAKRKTIEMECMKANFAQIQKQAKMGSFRWQDANPAFDRESKLSAAVAVTATEPAQAHPAHVGGHIEGKVFDTTQPTLRFHRHLTENGEDYYENNASGEVLWELPDGATVIE
jgi:hypothetical protein